MTTLLRAFSMFVASNPEFSVSEKQNLTESLRHLLDADPEKEIMRRALEHYANEYNWPFETESPEGFPIYGMDSREATTIAQDALSASEETLQYYLKMMLEEKLSRQYADDHEPLRYGMLFAVVLG